MDVSVGQPFMFLFILTGERSQSCHSMDRLCGKCLTFSITAVGYQEGKALMLFMLFRDAKISVGQSFGATSETGFGHKVTATGSSVESADHKLQFAFYVFFFFLIFKFVCQKCTHWESFMRSQW